MATPRTRVEPEAKPSGRGSDLRLAFNAKWKQARVVDRLGITVQCVLDHPKTKAFAGAISNMKNEMNISADQVLAMMDVFMAMVLTRQIDVSGKQVWRVFIARRSQLFERMERERKLGSGIDAGKGFEKRQREMLDDLLNGD